MFSGYQQEGLGDSQVAEAWVQEGCRFELFRGKKMLLRRKMMLGYFLPLFLRIEFVLSYKVPPSCLQLLSTSTPEGNSKILFSPKVDMQEKVPAAGAVSMEVASSAALEPSSTDWLSGLKNFSFWPL